MLKAIEVKPDVYWVGVIDWNERSFDGHAIDRGSTYNAYLIMDEHVTLIDTCKGDFADEMLQRIASVVDPSRIEYVIANHGEMDHSGALPRIMEVAPNACVVTSEPNGLACLKGCYGDIYHYQGVKTGDTLCIGKRTLSFTTTVMVHWPDNMVTYSDYDHLLFSNDAFGQHYTSSGRFDDEVELGIVLEEAKKYYANIVMPYSKHVARALKALKGLDFDMIAPSHGIIWRGHIPEIIERYQVWSQAQPLEKACVVYDTMYRSTAAMALHIADAFENAGIPTTKFDLTYTTITDVMTEVMDCRYVAVGSPTLNKTMLPTVAAFLCAMKGLVCDKGRIGIPFGSYGWITNGPDEIAEALSACGYELPFGTLTQLWVPTPADLDALEMTITEGLAQVHSES